MKTIYIDSDFKCHVMNDGTMRAIETDSFDDKCDAFIEGYRYVPDGEVWTNEYGVEFTGTMVAPWTSYTELAAAQDQYELDRTEMNVMETALGIFLTGGTE